MLLAVVFGLVFWGADFAVAAGVRKGLETFLKSGSRLESVQVSLWNSAVRLRGLQIDNPPDLAEGQLLTVENIDISFDLWSLLKERIVLSQISLQNLHLNVQATEYGWNTDIIADVFSEDEKDTGTDQPTKSLQIDKVSIYPLQVRLSYEDKGFDINLDEITLQNLDTSASPHRLFASVLRPIIKAIMKELQEKHRQYFTDYLKKGVKTSIRQKAEELKNDLRQKLKSIF